MSKQVDSWHRVSAGGSNRVARLSTREEQRLLDQVEGNIWGQDPLALLEAAESGRLDCLREEGE